MRHWIARGAMVLFLLASSTPSHGALRAVPRKAPLLEHKLETHPDSEPAVGAAELDRTIGQVLERREYAFRLPRHESANQQKGIFTSWMEALFKSLSGFWEALARLWEKFVDWLKGDRSHRSREPSGATLASVETIFYVLLAVAVVLLGWAAWRRHRRGKRSVVSAEAVAAVPDLHSDEVSADELPEDRWLQLAGELKGKGELRLALRALYLAALAHLGQRDLLVIARHKSNLDYRRELKRRAAQRGELLGAFEENVLSFENAWYGRRAVTPEVLGHFTEKLELIRAR